MSESETVEIRISRGTGCRATIYTTKHDDGIYSTFVTGGPGVGTYHGFTERGWPTHRLAVDQAATKIARYWRKKGVDHIAAEIDEFVDRFE